MEQYLPSTWHSSTFQTNSNQQIIMSTLRMKQQAYEILRMKYLETKKKKKRYSSNYLKKTHIVSKEVKSKKWTNVIINFYEFHNTR